MSFSTLNIYSTTTRQLQWAAARQKILNQNIALANVPGAKALDLKPLPSFGSFVLKESSEDCTLKKGLFSQRFKTFALKGNHHLSGNTIDAEEQLKLTNENVLFNKQVLSIRQKFSEIFSMIV